MNYGKNFWLVILPFHLFAIVGLYHLSNYYVSLIILWFLVGVIGTGVGGHRYFGHNQFKTWIPVRWLLAFLSTLGASVPITYWSIGHKLHHAKSDTVDDPHTPNHNNVLQVIYSLPFKWGTHEDQNIYLKHRWAKKVMVKQMRDPFFSFFHNYHFHIIYTFSLILVLVDPVFFYMYCLAYVIDFIRIGLVNYYCHSSGYRNHACNDDSTNNLLLGWFGMGFGWHNNHHAHPGKLILHERWWEIDVEGYIGYLLSKR
jgi:stearoyl-CoA desaturase (delta-9 desaturase)